MTQTGLVNGPELEYNYLDGNLNYIQRTHGETEQTYSFSYDAFGNTTAIKVGDQTLATYTYAPGNGLLLKQTYGNGDEVSFTYDLLGRLKTATYEDGRVVSYLYTGDGQVYSISQSGSAPVTYLYGYDTMGRLISSELKNGTGATLLRTAQRYNANNQLVAQSWQLGDNAYTESFTYNASDGTLATHSTATGQTVAYGYDALRRLSSVTAGVYTKNYTYATLPSGDATTQVSGLQYSGFTGAPTFGYTYDALGNIATYAETGKATVTYSYDAQGQLLSATDGTNSYTYTYDDAGNILTASNGTSSSTYAYGNSNWKDLLTAYNTQPIAYEGQTYDADTNTVTGTPTSGNPISYFNGNRWTFDWDNGRQLVTATNGDSSISYTYDADGLRTSKTADGVKHDYIYAGGKLLRETFGDNTLDFFYDANGTPFAVEYNEELFYYVTNLQGDVIAMVDSTGATVASYTYDPYGKVLTATGTLAEVNPLRYRGYVYDIETGFYYLQSRYYDPTICRFLNADAYASTGQGIIGHNMFAYCNNNPTNGYDSAGTCFHRWDFWNDCEACKQGEYCLIPGLAVSQGIYGSLNAGPINATGTIAMAFDTDLNVQLFFNLSGDLTSSFGSSLSGGTIESIYLVPDTSYLAGDSYYAGGSVSFPIPKTPIGISAGKNLALTSDGYLGFESSTGVAPITEMGLEGHIGYSHGIALTPKINLIDVIKTLIVAS